jgi:hypothetical protein
MTDARKLLICQLSSLGGTRGKARCPSISYREPTVLKDSQKLCSELPLASSLL